MIGCNRIGCKRGSGGVKEIRSRLLVTMEGAWVELKVVEGRTVVVGVLLIRKG